MSSENYRKVRAIISWCRCLFEQENLHCRGRLLTARYASMARRTCPRAGIQTPTSARSIPTSHSNTQESEMLTVERLSDICANLLLIPFFLIHGCKFIPIGIVLWHFIMDASHDVVLISLLSLVFIVVLASFNHIRKHCGGVAAPYSCPITNNLPCEHKQQTSSTARANALGRTSTFFPTLTTIEEVPDEQEKAEECRDDDDEEEHEVDENMNGERTQEQEKGDNKENEQVIEQQEQGWRKEQQREEEQNGSNNEEAPEMEGKDDDNGNAEEEVEIEREQNSDKKANEEKLEKRGHEQGKKMKEEKQEQKEHEADQNQPKLRVVHFLVEFGNPGKEIPAQTNTVPMGTSSRGENGDASSNRNLTSCRLTAAQKRQRRNWRAVTRSSETEYFLDQREPKRLGRRLRRIWRSFVCCGSSTVD